MLCECRMTDGSAIAASSLLEQRQKCFAMDNIPKQTFLTKPWIAKGQNRRNILNFEAMFDRFTPFCGICSVIHSSFFVRLDFEMLHSVVIWHIYGHFSLKRL